MIQTFRGTQLYQIKFAFSLGAIPAATKEHLPLCGGGAWRVTQHAFWYLDTRHPGLCRGSSYPSHVPRCTRLQSCCRELRISPCHANRGQTGTFLPSASWRYFCPTNFRYSSIALVASVFSLKIRTSCSPQRSTSDITKSVKKSWRKRSKGKRLL